MRALTNPSYDYVRDGGKEGVLRADEGATHLELRRPPRVLLRCPDAARPSPSGPQCDPRAAIQGKELELRTENISCRCRKKNYLGTSEGLTFISWQYARYATMMPPPAPTWTGETPYESLLVANGRG